MMTNDSINRIVKSLNLDISLLPVELNKNIQPDASSTVKFDEN